MPLKPVYDRALLLLGPKRDEVLTLEEVRQYGVDSFADPDYVQIYGNQRFYGRRPVCRLMQYALLDPAARPRLAGRGLRVRPAGLRINEAQHRGLGQNDRPATGRLPIVSREMLPAA